MESKKRYSELICKAETEIQTQRMDIWRVEGEEMGETEGQEERRWDELRDWD